jgi:large subunit ribosomal protein L23
MKDYLRSVYGVEVLHVRSAVFQAQVKRRETKSKYSNGQLYRPTSTKRMTVELVNPFVWPEVEEDLTPYVVPRPLLISTN